MLVIPVPSWVYLPFLCVLSVGWVIWVVTDLLEKGVSKYSVKRVLTYVASGAVVALLWGGFVG